MSTWLAEAKQSEEPESKLLDNGHDEKSQIVFYNRKGTKSAKAQFDGEVKNYSTLQRATNRLFLTSDAQSISVQIRLLFFLC